jgi:hypothetical protein
MPFTEKSIVFTSKLIGSKRGRDRTLYFVAYLSPGQYSNMHQFAYVLIEKGLIFSE